MSTRCANCGWQNEEGHLKCTKCNYRLDGSLNYNDDSTGNSEAPDVSASNGLKSTIAGSQALTDPWDGASPSGQDNPPARDSEGRLTKTPSDRSGGIPGGSNDQSGWGVEEEQQQPISPGSGDFDANVSAGAPPAADASGRSGTAGGSGPKVNPSFAGTIDPNRQRVSHQSFQLTPIARDGEADRAPVRFNGEQVSLNRDNLDPDNRSITSREQAMIEFADGGWHIVDRSDLKTTSVQVNRPYRLESGDILIIGDRKFVFEAE